MTERTFAATALTALIACGGTSPPTPVPLALSGSPVASGPSGPNPITVENGLPGTTNWNLRIRATQHQIEGYALAQSVAPGEPVAVAVSVNPGPTQFTWTVYRVGYYAGAGAREIARGGPVPGIAQPACPADRSTGLVACAWNPSFTLQTGRDWLTGIYLIRLVRADGWETWVPLVLRPSSTPEVLLIVPMATSQAYNPFQGESLYIDQNGYTGRGRAFQVSYDRPYALGFGAGNVLRWDQFVARWLESTGADVGYLVDEDVDRDPSVLAGAKAIVLSGHDEYWSGRVRSAMDAAVAGGTSLLLFGANAGYWQIRYAASADGRDHRVITCYKDDAPRLDPVGANNPDLTVQFRQPPISRPENALFGIMFLDWNTFGFPVAVRDLDHWALAGTGLAAGDVLPLVGGYEVDGFSAVAPTPPGVEVIGETPFLAIHGAVVTGQMVIRNVGDAVVFAAGGIDFAAALDGDRSDPRVQRIAANVLARALGTDAPGGSVSFSPVAAQGPFATSVTTIAGKAFSPGSDDGPAGTGRLRRPVAVAMLPGGALAILDAGDKVIRRLDASGTLSTLPGPTLSARSTGLASDAAGNLYVSDEGSAVVWKIDPAGRSNVLAGAAGIYAYVDGPGGTARFQQPAGLVVSGSTLYVADTDANAIRKVDVNTGIVSTVPGFVLQPTGVAVATDGTLYAVETGYQRVVTIAAGQVKKLAGDVPGFRDGDASQARLLPDLGLAVLPDGALAISDPGNYRVRLYSQGQVTTLAGSGRHGGADGSGSSAQFVLPAGLVAGPGGLLYMADPATSTVRAITR